jgi:outer membrane protein assembly factor BamB
MTTLHSLSNSRPEPACAAFEPLLPLVSHHLLEPEEEQHLQAHVAGCAYCRTTLAAYERLDAALRQRFEQRAVSLSSAEDHMKKIEEAEAQERKAPLAPVPHLRQPFRFRPNRVFSWVGAVAAVLVIALITTALFVSHHPSPTGTSPNGTAQDPAAPGVYYAAMTSGASPQTFIYALNPATGAARWHVKAPAGVTVTPAAVEHGILYVFAQDFGEAAGSDGTTKTFSTQEQSAKNAVYAFRTSDGKQLWHQQTGGIPFVIEVADGGVYTAQFDGTIQALNASTGAVTWHVSVGGSASFVQIADGVVYLNVYPASGKSPTGGKVVALNANDGSEKWHYNLHGSAGVIQVRQGLVAVVDTQVEADATNPTGSKVSSTLSVLNASDGSVQWTYAGDPKTVGSAFMQGDAVYVALLGGTGKEQPNVKLQALNASDGSRRWEKAYTNFTVLRPDQGAQEGKVYLATTTTIIALNAQDGSEAWKKTLGANTSFNQLAAGILFAEVQGEVYALNADDGSALWHASIGNSAYLTTATGQQVFGLEKVTDPNAHWLLRFFALNALNGAPLWHHDFTTSVTQPLVG